MKDPIPPTILVIIGITGDLAKRKLMPAIEKLASAGVLPDKLRVVGIGRDEMSMDEVLARIPSSDYLKDHLEMVCMDMEDAESYNHLEKRLQAIEKNLGGHAQRVFHLSVPPQISVAIIQHLGKAGFGKHHSTKLLSEKPFGVDLASAEELVDRIKEYFDEDQIYRIDHYLAKAMALNLLVFRGSNSLFKRTWNRDFIERIEVTASEKIGIEGRANFYEQTGALRDFVQNHLLQLAALTLMELPDHLGDWAQVPQRRREALEALIAPTPDVLPERVARGQYIGYAEEVQNPGSTTETFVSMTLFSSDPRWGGVPIVLTTGKALQDRYSEVRVFFKQEDTHEANQLAMRIAPREGFELELWSKRTGYSRELEPVSLSFEYGSPKAHIPEAYEQVFLDALRSDHTLFTSSEEVLASWRVLAPIQHAWDMSGKDLIYYEQGSPASSIVVRPSPLHHPKHTAPTSFSFTKAA